VLQSFTIAYDGPGQTEIGGVHRSAESNGGLWLTRSDPSGDNPRRKLQNALAHSTAADRDVRVDHAPGDLHCGEDRENLKPIVK
jgi:hypothetical protein